MINMKLFSPSINVEWRGWKPRIRYFKNANDWGPYKFWLVNWLFFSFTITRQGHWKNK